MGAGRELLSLLQDNEIVNKAIYVVRFCGKEKLEGERLSSYVEAAVKAQETNTFNAVTQTHQDCPLASHRGMQKPKEQRRGSRKQERRRYTIGGRSGAAKDPSPTYKMKQSKTYSGAVKTSSQAEGGCDL